MGNKYTVYAHVTPNMKMYVGITSQRVEQRWNNGGGYKNSGYFYNAVCKYGWDNIEHIIIAKGLTKKQACLLERDTIKYWGTTNRENGYNLSAGGESGSCGIKRTEEEKLYLSEVNSGENHPMYGTHPSKETLLRKSKVIWQYGLEGNFIREWESLKSASTELNIHNSAIGQCCHGRRKTAGGYMWRFKEDKDMLKILPVCKRKESNGVNKKKPVLQYTLGGVFVREWESTFMASKGTSNTSKNISSCCHRRCKTAGGYMWKFKTGEVKLQIPAVTPLQKGNSDRRPKPICQYTLQGDFIQEWGNIRKASVALCINASAISGCCNGKAHTAGGFVWKFK